MNKISDKLFKQHIIENTLFPQPDSNQFTAYLILQQKYPCLTYWSMDGWSCDALADYSINLVWNRDEIIDWTTKDGGVKGGTATAWNLAKKYNIPCFNLYVKEDRERLEKWLEKNKDE